MKTRALLLAAGRGSRMGIETASKPKCFTLLGGKRLLDWQIESLNAAGIDDITIVTGYRSEMFDGKYATVENIRWSETNMVASLFCVKGSNQDTIISYSDIVYKKEHVEALNDSTSDITITADKYWADLWKLRFDDPLDDAETFKSHDKRLVEIGKKTCNMDDIEAQYMGLLKLSKTGWNTMYDLYQTFTPSEQNKLDMTSLLNILLGRGIEIQVVFIDGGWCEADNYSDILAYEKELRYNKNWKHDWR